MIDLLVHHGLGSPFTSEFPFLSVYWDRFLEIPLPQRGHWARLAAGQTIPSPTLAPTTGATRFVSRPLPQPAAPLHATEEQEWLSNQLLFEKDVANRIVVQPELINPHRLVAAALRAFLQQKAGLEKSRKAFEERPRPRRDALWTPNFGAFTRPRWDDYVRKGVMTDLPDDSLPLRVSLETAERALRIWDAVLKAAEKRGFNASVSHRRLCLSLRGESVDLRLSEQLQRKVAPKGSLSTLRELAGDDTLYVGTGQLRIFIDEKMYSDAPGLLLEAQLNTVLSRVYQRILVAREHRIRSEEERRERAAAEERREAERMLADEARRQREAEQRRQASLLVEARAWNDAHLIRQYVSHLRASTEQSFSGEALKDLSGWLSWALEVAEKLDPSNSRLAQIPAKVGDDG